MAISHLWCVYPLPPQSFPVDSCFIHPYRGRSNMWLCCFSDSDVVSFDGRSSLFYRLSPRPRQMTRESISLKFKTLRNSGILLHAEGQSEHSLILELDKGKLLLLLQKGTTLTSVHTQRHDCLKSCWCCYHIIKQAKWTLLLLWNIVKCVLL